MQKGSGFWWSGSVCLSSTTQRMLVAPTKRTAKTVATAPAATPVGACASSCRPGHAASSTQAPSGALGWGLPRTRRFGAHTISRHTTTAEAPERHSLSHVLVRCSATVGTQQQQAAVTDTAAHGRGPAPASVCPHAAAAAAPAAPQSLARAGPGSAGQSWACTSSSTGLWGGVRAGPWRHAVPLPPAPVVSVWWAPLDQASSCRPELLPRLCSCLPPQEMRELSGPLSGPARSASDTGAGGGSDEGISSSNSSSSSGTGSGPKHRVAGEGLRAGGCRAAGGGGGGTGARGQQQGEEDEVRAKRVAARALARAVLARALGRAGGQGAGGGGVAALEGGAWVNSSADVGVPNCSSGSTSTSTNGGNGGPCGEPPRPQDLRFVRNSHGKPLLVGLEPSAEGAAAAAAASGVPAAPSGEHARTSSQRGPGATLSHLECSPALGCAGSGPLPVLLHHNLTHTHDLAGVAVVRPAVVHQQHARTVGAAAACTAASAASPPAGGASVPAAGGPCILGVGLDVERADRAPRNPLALARRRLAAREAAMVAGASGQDQARTFMWLWALKEAFVKARGTGISAPPGLKGFTLGLQPMASHAAQRLAAAHPGCRVAPGLQRITLELDPAMVRRRGPGQQQQQQWQDQRQQQQDPEHQQPAAASGLGAASAEDAVHPGTRFSMLLFQPTPGHIAALCIATCDAELEGEERGQGPTESGWVQAWESGVEHWWCLPLEAEGVVEGGQVVILAAT